ncbi:hypothetical protein [Sphingomonas sp. VNH70]|uniref:hypothetical protein n=1 Tax=Sphingomonas silueang TaxID=3156617 RepID=UPI0032B351F1
MRRALLAAALVITVPPAAACTVSAPYRPLTARPPGTQTVLTVDVLALDLRRYPAIARVRVVGGGKPGVTLAISYKRAPCGGAREPVRDERLVVFLRGTEALRWATPAEARAIR